MDPRQSPHRRATGALATTLATVLAVAACTGSDDPEPTPTPSDSAPPPSVHRYRSTDLIAPVLPMTQGPAAASAPADDDGLYVVAPKLSAAPKKGPLLVDTAGEPVWIAPEDEAAYDVRVQELDGEPVMTYYEGETEFIGHGEGEIVILDESYQEIGRVTTGGDVDPQMADIHDATITPDGTMLLLAYVPEEHDLTAVDGPEDGWWFDNVVQEVDIDSGDVLWEWRASDHVDITETMTSPNDDEDRSNGSEEAPFDWFHVNSANLAPDGDLLISARNTSAVYKIDLDSGDVEWVLGGKSGDFDLEGPDDGTGARFAYQHDARLHDDGTLTLFDNEGDPPVGDRSRGLRLALDTDAMTATVDQEWLPSDPELLAGSQGNVQVMENGNVTIGWGSGQMVSEYTGDGTLVREFPLEAGESYRSYRTDDWVGRPTDPPAVVVQGGTAHASWNGATEVAAWRLVAGESEDDAETVAEAPRDGFETALAPVPDGAAYVAVQALDADGEVLGTGTPAAG
ncbi:arylsulfotransferase family protein [Cellulosimicrobium arenosum]|uniref:Arylsulfotransferase family protein n=1 Tax=Cellulosimicrobium arenosum TaxID=2708133 RepID=A0A927PDB3_9MICO|nr:arylsulfotransferase family protein [Cellulosimicrobium arenosum]MBD8079666.1 arylsulfotransferase family protein [Cellulosimicrobium arenosum]